MSYPVDRLVDEVAFVAYHFHWPLGDVLGLEHGERRRWASAISSINERMNGDE